jgi:hypothetical protein
LDILKVSVDVEVSGNEASKAIAFNCFEYAIAAEFSRKGRSFGEPAMVEILACVLW